MQVKRIVECSKGSILQYFRHLLSYHLSLLSLFSLFLRGHFTQVVLYVGSAVVCSLVVVALIVSLNIFYCQILNSNGVGLQVLTTLVTTLPLFVGV